MNVPYGNEGPDCRVRFTKRLAWELSQLVTGSYPIKLNRLSIPPDQWEPLRMFVLEAKSVDTGFTANFGQIKRPCLDAIRLALRAVEHYCPHTQVKKAARIRRTAIDDYLGLSAVDRLSEIVKVC